MRKDLRSAYALIFAFKAGEIPAGTDISNEQHCLIEMLAQDLGVSKEGSFEAVILRVAEMDSVWNNRAMSAIIEIYDLIKAGNAEMAETVRADFLEKCPSLWYKSVVNNA